MLHLEDTPNTPLMVSNPNQEVIPPNNLQRIAEKIETTPNEKTAMILMRKLVLEQGMNYFAMGCLLKRMNEKKWYCGRDTFKAFCLEVLGFHPRKALYLIQIFDTLVEAKLTWYDIEDVGWTKLRILCSKGKVDPGDLPEWVDKSKSLTVLQLEAAMKDEFGDDAEKSQKLRMVGFYPEQYEVIEAAFEKVKQKDGVEAVSEAITLIAAEYVGTPNMSVPKEVTSEPAEKPVGNMDHEFAVLVKNAGPELTIKVLKEAFPAWKFEAYPPCDGDGLSHNGQSENGNNVDPEVGDSKPAENQASDNLDTSTAPASGNGGVAIEPTAQYEMPPVPLNLVRKMPGNAEASAAPKVEPAPKKDGPENENPTCDPNPGPDHPDTDEEVAA